ncbi:MAG: hypothetical protein ACYDA2_02660 [Acidimicrobiales bacterium]
MTSTPVVLSTPTLRDCGQHYRLAYTSTTNGQPHGQGQDCERTGFSDDISNHVSVGDSVNVTFQLPPNSCGS